MDGLKPHSDEISAIEEAIGALRRSRAQINLRLRKIDDAIDGLLALKGGRPLPVSPPPPPPPPPTLPVQPDDETLVARVLASIRRHGPGVRNRELCKDAETNVTELTVVLARMEKSGLIHRVGHAKSRMIAIVGEKANERRRAETGRTIDREHVLSAIKAGGPTIGNAEIHEHSGVPHGSIGYHLDELAREGVIRREGMGTNRRLIVVEDDPPEKRTKAMETVQGAPVCPIAAAAIKVAIDELREEGVDQIEIRALISRAGGDAKEAARALWPHIESKSVALDSNTPRPIVVLNP